MRKAIFFRTNKGERYILLDEGEELDSNYVEFNFQVIEVEDDSEYNSNAIEIAKEYEEYISDPDSEEELDGDQRYLEEVESYIKEDLGYEEYTSDYIEAFENIIEQVESDYNNIKYSVKLGKEKIDKIRYILDRLKNRYVYSKGIMAYRNDTNLNFKADDKFYKFIEHLGFEVVEKRDFTGKYISIKGFEMQYQEIEYKGKILKIIRKLRNPERPRRSYSNIGNKDFIEALSEFRG